MAEIVAASGSHKWSETAAWVGGVLPAESDDVVFTASSGEVKLNERTRIRSLKATSSYVSKLVFEALAELEVFIGKAPYIILWEAGESTIEVVPVNAGFTIQLGGGETREVTLPTNPKLELTINVGKLKLATKISVKAINTRFQGEFESNGQSMTLTRFELEGTGLPSSATFNPGTVCTVNTFAVESPQTQTTLEASGAKIIIESQLDTGSIGTEASKGTATWGEVEFFPKAAGQTFLLGTSTLKKLILNNTNGAKEFRFPNSQVTTVTEAIEVIPGSTKVKWAAETAGKKFKIKKATGTVQIENTELKGSVAEGGATFKNLNGKNLGENSGWTFEFLRTLTAKLESSASTAKRVTQTARRAVLSVFQNTKWTGGLRATFAPVGKFFDTITHTLKAKLEFSEKMFSKTTVIKKATLEFTNTFVPAKRALQKLAAKLELSVRQVRLPIKTLFASLSASFKIASKRTIVAQRPATFTPTGVAQKRIRKALAGALQFSATTVRRALVWPLHAALVMAGRFANSRLIRAFQRGSLGFEAFIHHNAEYVQRLQAAMLLFVEKFTRPEPVGVAEFDYVFLVPQTYPTLVVKVNAPWPLPVEEQMGDVPQLTFVPVIKKREVEQR